MNWFRLYYMMVDFNVGIILIYLPVYFRNVLHLSTVEIGGLYLWGGIITIIGSLVSSLVVQKLKDERTVVKVGMLMMLIGIIILMALNSIIALYIAFLFIFLMRSALYVIGDEIIINYASENFECDYSKIRSFGSIGWGLNFVLNGMIIENKPQMIFVTWVIGALLLLLSSFNMPKAKNKIVHEEVFSKVRLLKLAQNKNYVLFIIANALVWGVINNMQQYNQFYLEDLGGSLALYGSISAFLLIGDFVIMRYSTNVNNKLGDGAYFKFVNVVILIKFLVIMLTKNPTLIYVSLVFDPIYFGLCVPFVSQYIKKTVDKDVAVVGIAMSTVFIQVLGAIFALVFAAIYEQFSGQALYMFMAIIVTLAIILTNFIKFGNNN